MCSPHSEAEPLQSETIFDERLRQREREEELTRHEVSQPETGGGWGDRAQMATEGFSLRPGFIFWTAAGENVTNMALPSLRTKESSKDRTVKMYLISTKTAAYGFHAMMITNTAIFMLM